MTQIDGPSTLRHTGWLYDKNEKPYQQYLLWCYLWKKLIQLAAQFAMRLMFVRWKWPK